MLNLNFKKNYLGVAILLFGTEIIFAEKIEDNITNNYNAIEALGNIFEPLFNTQSNNITAIVTIFSILFGGYITFIAIMSAIKMHKIEEHIHTNTGQINALKTDVNETINKINIGTKDDIDKLEKWLFTQISDMHKHREQAIEKLEKEIQNKVEVEIVYSASKILKKVQKHSYEKLDYKMEEIKNNVEKRLFNYQKLIFSINILKKLEYDEVLKQDVTTEIKLREMVNVQHKYNETNNITIPSLLSNDIERDVVPALKKLSEEEDIFKKIIVDFFKNALTLDLYTPSDAYNIKYILQSFYDYDYDKDEKKED